MNQLEQHIVRWHESTFKDITEEEQLKKLSEECEELITAIYNGNKSEIMYEFADVVISGTVLMWRFYTKCLREVVADKLNINKTRDWSVR